MCIEDIAVDPQGKLWILAGGGRLGIFDGEKWLRLDDRSVNLDKYSDSLAIDPSGRAWIASSINGGLRTISTVHLPIVTSGWLNVRYGLTLMLAASFWVLLGLAGVVGSKKQDVAGTLLGGKISLTGIRNASRYVVFGLGMGLLVAIVGGFLHDLTWLFLTFGDLGYLPFNYWLMYSWVGPIAGALVGYILGSMARSWNETVPARRVGVIIGAVTGAWYGLIQVVANSYPEQARPFLDPEAVWVYVLVITSLQALLGTLVGLLGSRLFFKKHIIISSSLNG